MANQGETLAFFLSPCQMTYIKATKALLLLLLFCFLTFQGSVSLCNPGCHGTHSVDQAGFHLRELSAFVS